MLNQIYQLKPGTKLTADMEAWVRQKLLKLSRYKNLERHIDEFTFGKYKNHYMILAWKHGKPDPIPLPKNQLASNKSTKTRVLSRLRKVVEDQVAPLRIPGTHVDHIYPFSALVEDWLELNQLTYSKVRSAHYPSFYQYHASNARYQYLTPQANLAKSNKRVL